MAGKKKKYYVVWKGFKPGIYNTWDECKKQIEGFENARYKSFPTPELAEEAFKGDYDDFVGVDTRILAHRQNPSLAGYPETNSLSVDAACSGNPGILEYRGVMTASGKEVFHEGPFPIGTVNIGEFLALVHGLALLKKKGSMMPVYSDSRTAMAWVRNKKVKTKLERTPQTEKLFQLVDRALNWLVNNTYETPVLKWKTECWGEIPADFGRK